jgi:hypothetical protein
MADPSAELLVALDAAFRADAGMIAAFAPQKVKIYDAPPTMAPQDMPRRYLIIGLIQPLPLDGSDAANTEVTLDVWAIDDPPGRETAMTIGAAALACAMTIGDLPSHMVLSALPTNSQYLIDTHDTTWAHGIVKVEIVTQPKS